jgi:predicted enzyme related to lactoylglutathione lyase
MAELQHIAISYPTEDCEAVATFFKEVFGMTELSRRVEEDHPEVTFICLTDGRIDLSLVPSYVGYPIGINHIGFKVEDIAEVKRKAVELGGKDGHDMPHGRNGGDFVYDAAGVRIDLDEQGWNTDTLARVHANRGGK